MTDSYRLIQDGMPVAWTTNKPAILHYALVYSQDGPVEVQERVNGRWKTMVKMNAGRTQQP
jgi:hypothetical protein